MRFSPSPRNRSGITLTEILISILIMGVGLISLATLFPVGLERIRRAQRNVRSAQLARSAMADIDARNLFGTRGFQQNFWIAPKGLGRDPWITDWNPSANNPVAVYRGTGLPGFNAGIVIPGEGLPVAFDPLWWAEVNYQTLSDSPPVRPNDPAPGNADDYTYFEVTRFGRGPTLRPDPTDGGPPSAYGLQRLTLPEFLSYVATPNMRLTSLAHAAQVFATQDDIVLQTEGELNTTDGQGSPILPYLEPGTLATYNDWTYTWMFTGRRHAADSNIYIGDIVVFHNRPFGLDTITDANGNQVTVPAGERVVEAIFGYGKTIEVPTGTSTGYSPQDRTVLLRWPLAEPDPEVRVGGWIADVTYERNLAISQSRFDSKLYSGQRCHWYRVVSRSDAEIVPGGVAGTPYRQMVVTVDPPLKAKTEIVGGTGEPVHINAALVNPYVVHVFSKSFQAR